MLRLLASQVVVDSLKQCKTHTQVGERDRWRDEGKKRDKQRERKYVCVREREKQRNRKEVWSVMRLWSCG